MLQWFIRFPEFAELTEFLFHLRKSPLSDQNNAWFKLSVISSYTQTITNQTTCNRVWLYRDFLSCLWSIDCTWLHQDSSQDRSALWVLKSADGFSIICKNSPDWTCLIDNSSVHLWVKLYPHRAAASDWIHCVHGDTWQWLCDRFWSVPIGLPCWSCCCCCRWCSVWVYSYSPTFVHGCSCFLPVPIK